jgi:hypothetical protein
MLTTTSALQATHDSISAVIVHTETSIVEHTETNTGHKLAAARLRIFLPEDIQNCGGSQS